MQLNVNLKNLKMLIVNSIVFVARNNGIGARIEGISTFKNDIHERIRKIEENGNVKVIGYRLFDETFIIEPTRLDN